MNMHHADALNAAAAPCASIPHAMR